MDNFYSMPNGYPKKTKRGSGRPLPSFTPAPPRDNIRTFSTQILSIPKIYHLQTVADMVN